MEQFDRIARFSPLPIIDLKRPAQGPQDGLFLHVTNTCRKNFSKGPECLQHYQRLANSTSGQDNPIQCPFGFATSPFSSGGVKAAITGFVPFPRLGGSQEKIVSKRHPEARISAESVSRAISGLKKTNERLRISEEEAIKGASMALHEIRKLNGTIKITAERICRQQSPHDPDKAQPEWVKVWKSSELMSNEYDVIEVLANENLTELPPNMQVDLYKLLHKLVRIYKEIAKGSRRPILRAEDNFSPIIAANSKTFHILPSVFIENALKYAVPGSDIRIRIDRDENGSYCVLHVSNESEGQQILDDRVFQRGYRANPHPEGSGNGLYVAQLVAQQHSAVITVKSTLLSATRVRHTFRVAFKMTGSSRR